MKKTLRAVLIILVIIFLCRAVPFIHEYTKTSSGSETVTVEIPRGASGALIAQILKENGVIKSETAFRLKLRNSPLKDKLNYGTFSLYKSMCLEDILDKLSMTSIQGSVRVTIPEGYSAQMIAQRLEEKGLVSKNDFLKELANGSFEFSFIKDIKQGNGVKYRLEGYLFPNTYEFDSDSTAHEIINTLLGEFEKQYNAVKNENKTDMDMNDIIITASLIEREAKLDSERSLISGVIQNRLKEDMPLQIDATVVYAISDGLYDVDRVFYKDLEVDSPYNTYKYNGLPAGAICSPGIASVKAAMNPAKHNYMFYRTDSSKNDGSHIFTETFNQHVKNK